MYNYRSTLVRVVDGDTIVFNIDLGFRIQYSCTVRLSGVDTPEIYGVKKGSEEYERGQQASEFTKKWLEDNGPVFLIITQKVPEKYGRWLAEVRNSSSGETLNEAIKAHLGKQSLPS